MERGETKRKLLKPSPRSTEKDLKRRYFCESSDLNNRQTMMDDAETDVGNVIDNVESGTEEINQLKNQLRSITSPILVENSELRIVKAMDMLMNDKIAELECRLKQEIADHIETKYNLAEKDTELSHLKNQLRDLEAKFERMNQRAVENEMKSMRQNLSFSGVSGLIKTEAELRKWFNNMLSDLGCTKTVEISAIYRLKPKFNKPGDVIVRFVNYKEKRELYAQRFNLRSKPGYKEIYVYEQFPAEINEERKVLRAVAAEARLQHPELTKNISVYENTLYISNTRYKVSSLHRLPDSLQSIVHGYKQDDESTVFFTKRCPLSNHYPCEFEYNGTRYSNGEQFFMAQKARTFDDSEALTEILRTENPAACKAIGRKIKGYSASEWYQEVEEAIEPGLYNKFKANRICRNMLLSTGERSIGEATTEDPWGVGMRLDHPEILNQRKWSGKNIIGNILQNIRSRLREEGYTIESQIS